MGREVARKGPASGPAATSSPTAPAPVATPAERLLALQRRAGNRATCDAIQRKVGFEFEIDVPVSTPVDLPEGLPGGLQETYAFVTAAGVPAKQEIEDEGYDRGGYKVVTDHGDIGPPVNKFKQHYATDRHVGPSVRALAGTQEVGNLEYVTAPLDENATDADERFAALLGDVATAMQAIQASDPAATMAQVNGTDGPVYLGIPGDLKGPDTAVLPDFPALLGDEAGMRAAVNFRSYPQATVGIDLTKVSAFVQDQTTLEGDHEKVVAQLTTNHLGTVTAGLAEHASWAGERAVAEVVGFLTVLLQYVVGNVTWRYFGTERSTKKNATPFWSKVDLGRYRLELSEEAATILNEVGAGVAPRLDAIAVQVDGHWAGKGYPVVTNGPLDHRQGWITGVLAGEPMGDWEEGQPLEEGYDVDPGQGFDVLPGGRSGLVVEHRALAGRPEPDALVQFGLQVVEMVRKANR